MRLWLPIIILLTAASGALAGARELPAAAGRIEFVDGSGTCSGALVRDDLVLTAAHCAGDDERGRVFRPGDGVEGEVYPVDRAVRHPLYDSEIQRPEWRFRFDLALLHLAVPVPADRVEPIRAGPEAQPGETLYLVSWRDGEGDRPRQRACTVLDGLTGLVTLGCHVRGGESGAPVLRKTADGLELVAVISSRTNLGQQPVAQASDVALRLPPLLDLIE